MGVMIWNAIPTLWRVGLVLALLASLGGVYAYVRHQGYEAGYSRASAECEAARRAQEEANRKALREAEQRLLRQADELSIKNMEMDNAITALSEAAAADPDGGLDCLGLGGVLRLNQIQ
jgi:hypothetical protein